jgi:UDP-N-acetyl-D-galactosamine dehydrogenase
MYEDLITKKTKLAVIGLGYVGLPIALAFARKLSVIGFDIREDRIQMMKKGIDPSNELTAKDFDDCDIYFTSRLTDLEDAGFYIIAVPTPIDEHKLPDLNPLMSATEYVGQVLSEGNYVVYESTVYPGCTEEDCVPLLEKISGLKYIQQFKVGFSPERINPGDKKHSLEKIIKVTSGCDETSAEEIARTYELIIDSGVHRASSIKVAEAAKIIENTQRDINIAFMNELSMIFNLMDINTYEVIEAATTKWNFLRFYPGLVGGHCIGVDPYYLSYKAKQFGHHAQIINAGRSINDNMGTYIAELLVKKICALDKGLNQSKILILGITFKENVGDIRNSKVIDLIREFQSFRIRVDVMDPRASSDEVRSEYGIDLYQEPQPPYDVIVVAVNHDEYIDLDEDYFKSLGNGDTILVDIKGIFKNKIKQLTYWSL